MKTWLRGSSCSLVNPWGAGSLSKSGDRLLKGAFSIFARDSSVTVMKDSYWLV